MRIVLRGAAYRYPGGASVGPVDLAVAPGELVVLTGPTGCGKSTVLRLAAGLLQRHGHGTVTGSVTVDGQDPAALVAAARVRALGFVGQDPDDSMVADTVAAELGFGAESAGWTPDAIDARVAALLDRLGLRDRADRAPAALSGGQRQRLAIGAALVAGAQALLLDEPLSQLDPDGAAAVMRLLAELAGEGVAVLCVEHRLDIALPLAHRAVLMDAGRVVADPLRGAAALRAHGLRGPALDELRERTGAAGWRRRPPAPPPPLLDPAAPVAAALPAPSPPLLAPAALGVAAPSASAAPVAAALPAPPPPLPAPAAPVAAALSASAPPGAALSVAAGRPVLRADGLAFAWRGEAPCLHGVSLAVTAGERVALVGANGAGKSTLLGLLSGRLRARAGTVRAEGRVVEVPQNPDLALFCETVEAELAYGPREARLGAAEVAARAGAAAAALSVEVLLARPPQALSRGQRLRVAVAAALACRPALLLLDEPTSGQDRDQVDRMLGALAVALPDGAAVFACHDLDVVLRHATRVVVLHGGRVHADGPPLATLLAAAADGLPLSPPPLARLCADLGLAYGPPEVVADLVEPA